MVTVKEWTRHIILGGQRRSSTPGSGNRTLGSIVHTRHVAELPKEELDRVRFASRMDGKREMKECILVDLTFLADHLPQDSADKLWEYIEAQKSTPVYN